MRLWCAGWLVGSLAASGCGGESASHGNGHPAAGGSAGMSGAGGNTPSPNETWVRQFAEQGNGVAFAVGVDASNNVFALAVSDRSLPAPTLFKLDRAGATIRETPILDGGPSALAVHPNGNAVVASTTDETDAMGLPSHNLVLTMYDQNGSEHWRSAFKPEALEEVLAVNADHDEHTFVLWSSGTSNGGSLRVLSELDTDGKLLSNASIGGMETFLVTTVDRRGNVLAVVGDDRYLVSKFDKAGNALWATPVGSDPTALYGDDDGTVLVVGRLESGRYLLTQLDIDGNPGFSKELGDTTESTSFVVGDSVGRSFTVGTTTPDNGSTWDIRARRFDVDGTVLATLPLGSDQRDFPLAVTVDSTGALLVVGATEGAFPGQMHLGGSDAFIARTAP